MAVMKLVLLTSLATFLLVTDCIEASPVMKPDGVSQHERELFRELICVLRGKTARECIRDSSIDILLEKLTDSEGDEVSDRTGSDVVAPSRVLPLPPAGVKRDAFYSDWKRRK